jgi:uncharacterized repeat protein (TIGR01451 family)
MKPFYTPVLRALLVLTGIALLVGGRNVYAVEIPPDNSVAFIQTSGPNADLGNGDFYTSVDGANEPHIIRFEVPCTWPANRPITVALFDPESLESGTATDIDEVAGESDDTTFTLRQGTTILATETYTPTGGTDGLWVELLTFVPQVDCSTALASTYTVETTTSDNDEQSWRLRVGYDPDCVNDACAGIGADQSELLDDGDEVDDLDGTPGTGDELLVGLLQVSFQHASNECQIFYFQVDATASEVVLHNFDMDDEERITYRTPTGREIDGTLSGQAIWNNGNDSSTPPERGGDVVEVLPGEGGVWSAEVCTGPDNQYIFEGERDKAIFYDQPPTPQMDVAKDNGVTVVRPNDLLTYTIAFTNTSSSSDSPGAAARVNLTDQLPEDTTFVDCEIDAPLTGTCTETAPGLLTIDINELIVATPGENSGSVQVTVRVNPGAEGTLLNTVDLNYQDIFGNNYSPVSAEDEDVIEDSSVLTATKDDSLLVDNDGNGAASSGDILRYTIIMTNVGNLPAEEVVFADTPDFSTTLLPDTLTTTAGTIISGNNPGDTTIEIEIGTVLVGASVTITFEVQVNDSLSADVTEVANQGVFTGDNVDPTPTDDPGTPNLPDDPTITPLVPPVAPAPPVLTATKTVVTLETAADAPCLALVDETLEYTVVITNSGNTPATQVNFVDTPDDNTRLVPGSVQADPGTVLSGNAPGDTQVQVAIGTLGAGAQVTIVYRVTVLDLPPGQTVLENQGRVSASELNTDVLTDDPTTAEIGDPTQTLACAPPPSTFLTATKDDSLLVDNDDNGAVSAGETLKYTIIMTNSGDVAAEAVVFTDTPDANTSLITGTVETTLGEVVIGNNPGDTTVEIVIGTVPVGASVTITFEVQVNDPLPSGVDQVANQGVFTGSNLTDNTQTDDPGTPNLPDDPTITPLVPPVAPAPPILEATKAVVTLNTAATAPCLALVDETLQYTVIITNSGNSPATLVTFVDTPDANTRLVPDSVQTNQGTVQRGNADGDTQVQVAIGTLGADTQVTIVYQVTVLDLPQSQVMLENQGRVSADELSEDVLTDDPDTVELGDPTTTLACVPGTTAIELLQFTATREGATIQVRWVTGAELDTWGFHLYRSTDGSRANAVRVTPELIIGRGRGQEQTVYTWIDRDVAEGTSYTYWLQEIELDGSTHEYGPAARTAPQRDGGRIFLPLVIR